MFPARVSVKHIPGRPQRGASALGTSEERRRPLPPGGGRIECRDSWALGLLGLLGLWGSGALVLLGLRGSGAFGLWGPRELGCLNSGALGPRGLGGLGVSELQVPEAQSRGLKASKPAAARCNARPRTGKSPGVPKPGVPESHTQKGILGTFCPALAFWLRHTKTASVITRGVSRETSSCCAPLPSHNISRMPYHARRRAVGYRGKARVLRLSQIATT